MLFGSSCRVIVPPSSSASETLAPGSIDMILFVVENADEARQNLIDRGLDASEVEELQWGKFVYLTDPDGNKLSLQELPKRPPGFTPEK